jgi:outer membrane receptor protein involved in Fe transport
MNKPTFPTASLFAVALAASPLLAHSQAPGRPAAAPTAAPRTATGRVSGTITDAANGKPVSYATVNVINPTTNSPVNGGVAGDDGKFVLPVPAGTYRVEVSFIGYTTQVKDGVTVTAGGNLELGTIALAGAAQKLAEVVVTGKKPLIEERVDRTIYNADVDKTTQGGDATDVLKRVPLLSVDLDGNVSLRGSSNIRVLINNKPSTIAASSIADALKQIPADQIQTVEVITSPSAKYDAEGSGGIINIVTKQNNLRGGSLSLNTGVGLRATNLGLNGNYSNGKFGVSLGGFGRASYNQPGSFENAQQSIGLTTGQRTSSTQSADTRRNDAFGRYTLGLTYDFDKHNSLAGSLAYGIRNGDNYQDNLITRTGSGADPLRVSLLRDVATTNNSNTVDASLNYTHLFETKQRELSILTLFSRNNQTNNFTNSVFDPSGPTDRDSRRYVGQLGNNNDSYNEEYTGQLDYQTPTVKDQLLEVGVKDIVRRVSSDYSYFYDASRQPPAGSSTLNNSFRYRQNVAAGYATYTIGLPKGFTVKPGVRFEYTTISADFTDGQGALTNTNIPDYGVLVPGVNLSRKLENGNVVKLSYNRRIQRPSLQFLNPNVQASNPLNVSRGNAELGPEYTNNYEVGYSTTVKQKVNLNVTAFVRNTTNAIQTVRTPLPDELNPNQVQGALLTTYLNSGVENAYGGSLFAGANTGKLSLNGSVDAYYAVLKNNDAVAAFNSKNSGVVINARAFGSYDLGKNYSLQAFGFYRGQQVQLQGSQSGFGIYSLSLQKSFAEKRGSIGFGAENFFTGSIHIRNNVSTPYVDNYQYTDSRGASPVLVTVPINGSVLQQNSTNVVQNLNFKINFSYRIGKLTVDQRPRNRKSVNNDDLKDGGDGGGGIGGGGDVGGGQGGGGGARPSGAGQRPAGAAGYPGAGQRPAGAPGQAAPTDTTKTAPLAPADSTTAPAGQPGLRPTTAPADSSAVKPSTPATTPNNPTPVNAPSPGTTSPSGIVPAGSPGGRP